MAVLNLKIAELRKRKGMTQMELADVLGISFQSVSKWENNVTMPDITLLPALAECFQVSVDELLGLKPLRGETYLASETAGKEFWNERLQYLKRTRDYFWNTDYLQFLIEKVWKINRPVSIMDCGCGYGFLGEILLPLLPEGSTYTGIDFAEVLIEEARRYFQERGIAAELICEDVLTYTARRQYDFVISQAVLRHSDRPYDFLAKMASFAKENGLVVCVDVNRELESDGLYIEGFDYSYLCERKGFRKMWKTELERQGRDYAVSMKVPEMMRRLGLRQVDVRLNDKVNYVSPDSKDYEQILSDYVEAHGWDKKSVGAEEDEIIRHFMNHGMDRSEADFYCRKQRETAAFIGGNEGKVSFVHFYGMMISYGIK